MAPIWKRGVAHLLDFGLLLMLTAVLILVWQKTSLAKGEYLIRTTIPLVCACLYFVFFHGRTGQTPGKMVMHIEVLRPDGGRIGYAVAALRSIVYLLCGLLFPVAVAIALQRCDPEHWLSLAKREQVIAVHSVFPSAFRVLKATSWVWWLADVACLLTTKTRRSIHDVVAGTIVVSK